jgi:hypothetical protein
MRFFFKRPASAMQGVFVGLRLRIKFVLAWKMLGYESLLSHDAY